MKVLLINGSPRKGNTFKILKEYSDILKSEKIDTEIINLRDYKIDECTGCYRCVTDGKQSCPFKNDDVEKIWKKIKDANGVVLSAPVYALGMPSILKKFTDRIAYNAHRPEFYNKPAVLVSTTAGMGIENVFKQLKWYEIAGFRIISKTGFLVYPTGKDKLKKELKKRKIIRNSAVKLINEMTKVKKIHPGFIQVIQFYGLKLNCNFGKDVYKADYEYFKNRDFFTDEKVNPIKKVLGLLIYKIGLYSLEKTITKI